MFHDLVFDVPVLENVELVDMYGPGGYHPIDLGNVIREKFKIIHKPGNGGFALVWLARDLEMDRNVALKALKSGVSNRELEVLEHLRCSVVTVSTTDLIETFQIEGPNGTHQCLVLDLGGPSLQHLTLNRKRPPLDFLRKTSKNLANGLAALHLAGVCHGGFRDWTEDEIYRNLGAPMTASLLLLDGTPAPSFAPRNVVDALDYSSLKMESLTGNVVMTDFGEAFFKGSVPKGVGTPASFFAPELAFGYRSSCAAGPWALDCLVFEIHTFRMLIPAIFGSDEEAIAYAIEAIGALPETWKDSYYDKEKPLLSSTPNKKHGWYRRRCRTLDHKREQC